jgi:hypothetical protein
MIPVRSHPNTESKLMELYLDSWWHPTAGVAGRACALTRQLNQPPRVGAQPGVYVRGGVERAFGSLRLRTTSPDGAPQTAPVS